MLGKIVEKSIGNIEYLVYILLVMITIVLFSNIITLNVFNVPIWRFDLSEMSIIRVIIGLILYLITFLFNVVFQEMIGIFILLKLSNLLVTNDIDTNEIYSIEELRNEAIKSNNSVMYEDYKELNKNRKVNQYSIYFYWFNIFMLIYHFIVFGSDIFIELQKLRMTIIIVLLFMISILYFTYIIYYNKDYTGVRKRGEEKLIQK